MRTLYCMESKIRRVHPVTEWFHHRLGVPYRLHVHADIGTGPTIILLHGIASSSLSWQYLIPLISQQYRCVMIDLLGFGDSPKPDWSKYTPDDHIKHIRHTLKKLRLNGPVIMAGHSLGSLLALRYARTYPNDVSRLIMVGPPIYLDDLSPAPRRVRMATSAYFRAYKYLRAHKEFTIANAARIARMIPIPGTLILNEDTWLPFSRSLEECIEHQTVVEDIRLLHTPIDIFYGTFDEFIIKANIISLAKLPHVTLHRPAARHVISRGYAQAIAKILTPQPAIAPLRAPSDTIVVKS